MARYEIGYTKTTGAAAGLLAQIRTGAARDIRVWEIALFASSAASGTVGLIRPSAVGATFTSTGTGQAEDNIAGAGVAVVDTAATTAPTIGTTYMRRITLPATIGAGFIWTFPQGIVVPTSTSLALWQISAVAVAYDGWLCFDE